MALHGSLDVNGHPIGQWEAVRRDEVVPGWHVYDVHVHVHGTDGRGQVTHRYLDGAAVLAAKALGVYAQAVPAGPERLGRAVCKGLGKLCGLAPHHGGPHVPAGEVPTVLGEVGS